MVGLARRKKWKNMKKNAATGSVEKCRHGVGWEGWVKGVGPRGQRVSFVFCLFSLVHSPWLRPTRISRLILIRGGGRRGGGEAGGEARGRPTPESPPSVRFRNDTRRNRNRNRKRIMQMKWAWKYHFIFVVEIFKSEGKEIRLSFPRNGTRWLELFPNWLVQIDKRWGDRGVGERGRRRRRRRRGGLTCSISDVCYLLIINS